MTEPAQWLLDLREGGPQTPVDGLVPVDGYREADLTPEQVAVMEKAAGYGATAVFFEAARHNRPPVPQALVFAHDRPGDDTAFAHLHRRLWSWGGVPLLYRKTPGLIQLFRCAHKPEFESNEGLVLKPYRTLVTAAKIAEKMAREPWWDAEQLRNGTLWDDPGVCRKLLSANQAAQKTLVDEVQRLYGDITRKRLLPGHLRRKLVILSLLIAYLEARCVFEEGYFARFHRGATRFFEVLADGPGLVRLLADLEERFNGHVFVLGEQDRATLRQSQGLARFARLVEGRQEPSGQRTLWQRYSFADLPVELISHVYQLFVNDTSTAVYTPPFLVRLMLGEALSWERLDRLEQQDEIILDPCCGSGVFLVEAYKRLVLHWRSRNGWRRPGEGVLKRLLDRVQGIDLEEGAVELTAFSLCLALCDALEPEEIRASVKLFPKLKERTIHTDCFFDAREQGKLPANVGVVVGNPPFTSSLRTEGAKRAYSRYQEQHGALPDKQLAYLFLHESMEALTEGGLLSMLQQYNFLYNQKSLEFRREFIRRWDVREILDFISVRGLFKKSGKDTKVVAVVAEAARPSEGRHILHATFRRSGRACAEQGFDIDYYDMHWLPRRLTLTNDAVWRTDLLGGGRVLGFVDRLRSPEDLGQYAEKQGWDYGEGFIAGASGKRDPAPHITGKPLIEPRHLRSRASLSSLKTVTHRRFKSWYTRKRFQAPMLLVHEHEDLASRYFPTGYYTYGHKIVGFCTGDGVRETTRLLAEWLETNRRTLSALVCAGGTTMFTQRASSVGLENILRLPSPERELDISPHEQILVDDIVDYYRDLIRLGHRSAAMKQDAIPALPSFNETYSQQINAVYKENRLRALQPQTWPGVICQPFVFGEGEVDWEGTEELKDKLDALLREQRSSGLTITRIARIYDGACIYLLKPDRLRYWLRSVALRDADETMADLWDQGF